MTITTTGVDVGTSMIKSAAMRFEDGQPTLLAVRSDRMRQRDTKVVVEENYQKLLEEAGIHSDEVDYLASTGEEDAVEFRRGHFYSMTTHARGGLYLCPDARAVLDVGALHARAINVDERGKVLSYQMTSQCASGSGQFLENISRYLGVALDEVGTLSKHASAPETVSSICAVLAETDVINMVSRGITAANILKGIHLSMAGRFVKLLKSARAGGTVMLTGGLASDDGLVAALAEIMTEQEIPVEIRSDENSIAAGAIGAAIWGAFRHEKLLKRAG